MQPDNKATAFALKSIMKNPKLSKILEEGFNAPIGSTKRAQAKSIVSIIKKYGTTDKSTGVDEFRAHNEKVKKARDPYSEIYRMAFDGQGGGNNVDPNSLMPKILKRAPKPANNFSLGYTAPSTDGQGGPFVPKAGTERIANPDEMSKYSDIYKDPNSIDYYGTPMQSGFLTGIKNKFVDYRNKNMKDTQNDAIRFQQTQKDAEDAEAKRQIINGYKAKAVSADEEKKWNEYQKYLSDLQERKITGYITKSEASGQPKKATDFGLSNEFTGADITAVARNRAISEFQKQYPGYDATYDKWSNIFKVTKTKNPTTSTNSKTNTPSNTYPGLVDPYAKAAQKPALGFSSKDPALNNQLSDSSTTATSVLETTPRTVAPTLPENPANKNNGSQTSGSTDNPWSGTPLEGVWATLPTKAKNKLKTTIGSGMFATNTMADRELMRELYPGLSDDQIPWGAGLLGQVTDLRDRLKEEYKLDEIANERKDLLNSGSTLTLDMTKYLRDRDTYIKSVDTMMDGVRNKIKTGYDSPAAQDVNKKYLDYLTVLKGRQNTRYIDLLNSTVTHHDAKMKEITDQYNSQKDLYDEELKSSEQITKDRYKQIYDNLSNMWELYAAGPTMAREATQAQLSIDKTEADNIKQQLLNAGITTDKEPVDVTKEMGDYEDRILDNSAAAYTKGEFRPNISLAQQADFLLADGKKPEGILQTFITGINNSSYAVGKAMIDKFEQEGGNDLFKKLGYTGEYDVLARLKSAVKAKGKSSSSSLISGKLAEIKNALSFLVSIDPQKLENSKSKFMSKGAGADTSLLESIWNYYKDALAKNPAYASGTTEMRKSMFKMLTSTDPKDDGSNDLATKVSDY